MVVARSSNGCPKISSKSSGGSIKAKGEKREYWLGFARWKGSKKLENEGTRRRARRGHKRRILHV